MDYYRKRLSASDLYQSKSSSHISPYQNSQNFEKLISFLREKYESRIESLQNAQHDFKKDCALDAALSVMKQNPITEKFLDVRINEIFSSALMQEQERTISLLQDELAKKQAEYLKQGKAEKASAHLKHSDEFERLAEENVALKRELNKVREVCMENEKLQRYCEQLENERELGGSSVKDFSKIMEAQKMAGIETIKEVQTKFKKKSKLLKKKIIEQKSLIERLNEDLETLKNRPAANTKIEEIKETYEKRENDLIEKQKQQVLVLQNQFQALLNKRVKEIEDQINPRLKVASQEIEDPKTRDLEKQANFLKSQISEIREKNEKLESKNSELENTIFSLKTQLELSEFKRKPGEIEKWQQEALLHEETKIKLKKAESKLTDLHSTNKALEDRSKKLSETLRAKENYSILQSSSFSNQTFKVKKLQSQVFLLKSQINSFKNLITEDLALAKTDYLKKIIDFQRFLEKHQKTNLLTQENQKLSAMLRSNSEAFDRLQEEVKTEYSKIKIKSQEKLAESLKTCRVKHDKEIDELKTENRRIQELLDRANSTIFMDSHLNKQLKEEIESLKNEKEAIRKKQQVLEEKFQTQSNNFKLQLKSKQQELEILKKSTGFN